MDQQEAVFGVLNIFNNSITFQRIQRSSGIYSTTLK